MKFLYRIISLFVFSIVFLASTSSAQTTVCSGDSVVLVLNGYKRGDISWKQSPDKTTWSAATGTATNDSLAFTATNTLYYQATVTEGTCSPFYSDTTLVIVNSTPPVAKPATGITQTGFAANWSAVTGATGYYLDVATDAAFTSFVAGYKNIDLSNNTTYNVSPLSCHTTYYYRVRDTSDGCTKLSANSNTIMVTTDTCPPPICSGKITDSRDGKTYKIIAIGTQCWMAENLNVGKMIMGVQQQTQYDSLGTNTIEKYCYGDNADSCTKYGGLYLWDEMMNYGTTVSGDKGPKGICPTAWHIPTDDEYTTLVGYFDATAGIKLKDTTNWTFYSEATKGTNSSGFSALPGGARNYVGQFYGLGDDAYFWTATGSPTNAGTTAWIWYLHYTYAQVHHTIGTKTMVDGYSVRCVKD